MKKIAGMVIGVVGVGLSIVGIGMKLKESVPVSAVGGVDGPTAVFVAGRLDENAPVRLLVAGMCLLMAGAIMFRKRH